MRTFVRPALLEALLLLPVLALAQGAPKGFWNVPGSNAAHQGWQKAETGITPETVATTFKLLWKLKLGSESSSSFTEPLLFPGMITGKGFKDFAFWADTHTVYAVDSELGTLVWQKSFDLKTPSACAANLQLATEAPQVIHFGAPKTAGARPAPPPPSDERVPAADRRIGGAAGGGYFGLRGIYVLTSDGYLHEQIMATGHDYAPPVKLIAAASGPSFGLNMNDKIVYAAGGTGCHNVANALWSIDLNTPAYAVNTYKAGKLSLAGLSGPAIASNGDAYVVTGSGPADAASGVYPNSVVALSGDGLKARDWYSPAAHGNALAASPVIFPYKNKELMAAPGSNGSLVLLDSASLGGADHHTPLAQTVSLTTGAKRAEWEGLATAPDKTGSVSVFASIVGPVSPAAGFALRNGPAPHGSIAAFKVEEKDGHPVLTPVWVSRDLVNPATPVIVNGVVFALEGGTPATHATLYALDAATGKQLFSSGDAIATYTHLSGLSAGDGHVFFTTHDNTLYSFGLPLEH